MFKVFDIFTNTLCCRLHSIFHLLHVFCGFKLPSGVISFSNAALLSSLLLFFNQIYKTLYLISPTIQLYAYCFIELLFKSVKRREGNVQLQFYIITFIGSLVFCVDSNYHLVSFAFSLKNSPVFLVKQIFQQHILSVFVFLGMC